MIDYRDLFFNRLVYFNGDIRLATYGLGDWNYDWKTQKPYEGNIGDYKVLDVRHLSDDHGNKDEDYKRLIDKGCEMLDEDKKLVIACMAGISRSNAIAMGILIQKYNMNFDQAYEEVRLRIKNCLIEPSHLKALKRLYPCYDHPNPQNLSSS